MTAATIINSGFALVLITLGVTLIRLSLKRRPTQAARAAEAAARVGLDTVAAREIDELELIYSLPAATSGTARIRQAIRDHEPEGDQP